ncbi:MAG: DUF3570 domain-containing protein, partial [Lewinella sp.]|nr:DUF3570 domain-containing protein [Lewinella sp.]
QATFSQVLNRRMQLALSGEVIYMSGLLSTPFHRVYFADQARPDIERLPDSRLKIPLGLRLNIFPFDGLVLRTDYRYYWDDFGIMAHTLNLEAPIKLTRALTLSPFYRYHTQTAADYFAPYAVHTTDQQFYTSDYDLSELHSYKVGLGVGISPLYGIGRMDAFARRLLVLDKLQLRAAYYHRSTGLTAFLVSLDLGFRLPRKGE